MYGSERARALHRRYPAIDLHADPLMWARFLGYDLKLRHDPPLPMASIGGHVDFPRLREGGIGAQFLGLVSLPIAESRPAEVAEEQLDVLDALIASTPDVSLVRTAAELEACRERGTLGLLAGIEGAHLLQGSTVRLKHLADRGARYLGLVHFSANEAAFPAYGWGTSPGSGLTRFGRDLVRTCEDLGVIVDLAHLNRQGFMEACAMARRPLIVSHTGVSGGCKHWRNIDDEQLRAVAATGGVVGIIFVPRYLGGSGLEDVVRHIRHVIEVAGEEVAALGSDWDGFVIPTPDLRDAAHLPLLTDALLDSGLSEPQVAKVLRGNVLRLLAD